MSQESKSVSDTSQVSHLGCDALAKLDKRDKLGGGMEGLVFRTCGDVPPSPKHRKITLKEDKRKGESEVEECELPVAIKWGHYYFEEKDNALFDAKIGSAVTR